jgi:hypothetical protein
MKILFENKIAYMRNLGYIYNGRRLHMIHKRKKDKAYKNIIEKLGKKEKA